MLLNFSCTFRGQLTASMLGLGLSGKDGGQRQRLVISAEPLCTLPWLPDAPSRSHWLRMGKLRLRGEVAKPGDLPVDEFICSFKSPLSPNSVSTPVLDARGTAMNKTKT